MPTLTHATNPCCSCQSTPGILPHWYQLHKLMRRGKILLFINIFAVGSRFSFKHLCLALMKISIGWILTYGSKKFGIYLHPQSENSIQWMELFLLKLQDSQVPAFRAIHHCGTRELVIEPCWVLPGFCNEKVQRITLRSLPALTFYSSCQFNAAKK